MYKLVALFALLACAAAAPGYIAAPALHAPVVAAPAVAVAHSLPVATSYANTYKVSVRSPLVAAAPVAYLKAAPVVHTPAPVIHAPVVHAPAPVIHAPVVHTPPPVIHAPVVAHAPLAYAAHAPYVALH